MATTKTTARKKPATKKKVTAKTSTLLKSLPDSVENLEIVQQVASVLGELQNRVIDVKEEASRELHKVMKRYETNYKGLEKKLYKVTSDAKKQAQTSMIQILQKWHEHKEKLPTPLAKELEKIISQIGMKVMEKTAKAKPKKTAAKKTPKATVKAKKASAGTKKAKVVKEKAPTKRKAKVIEMPAPTTTTL
jgi:hypothetical protein